jgi:GrpB-like predicted nucleotidyltransferase (UPF0157 family)
MTVMPAVVVVPYSAAWPRQFRDVRDELLHVFQPLLPEVEHIGSTAVVGLAAKPVIDVLLGVRTLVEAESKIADLRERGYTYRPEYEHELPLRRYFTRPQGATLRVHLHAVEHEARLWREHLGFRELLRGDADLRARYQALKLRLAQETAHDKAAYTAAKAPFIRAALATLGATRAGA